VSLLPRFGAKLLIVKRRKVFKERRYGIVLKLARIVTILVAVQMLAGCGEESSKAERTGKTSSQEAEKSSGAPVTWTPELVHGALKSKNPDYNGKALFQIRAGQVVAMQLTGTGITELSPLKWMGLQGLDLRGLPISDLEQLKGLPLKELYLEGTKVEDLAPLQGMKLFRLYLKNMHVRDLAPLRGMPLMTLNLYGTEVRDLSPLRGMPLQYLWLNMTSVSDISPISGSPLLSLTLHKTGVGDLSPLAGSNLQRLHIGETPVTDLTPIRGLALTRLVFTPGRITKGIEIARNMTSIREIGPTFENRMDPSQFWSLYDQGKFK